jgi:hypothetical protein
MMFVFRVQEVTAARCGTPGGANLALLLMARDHPASDR